MIAVLPVPRNRAGGGAHRMRAHPLADRLLTNPNPPNLLAISRPASPYPIG